MEEFGHPLRDGLSPTVEPVPVSPVPASIPDADDIAFNNLMESISSVYSLRVGHTLTQNDYDAIQNFDKHYRSQEDNAIEAFHRGYTQGLREGGSADIEKMQERLDGKQVQLSVEKAMRHYTEARCDKLHKALKRISTIDMGKGKLAFEAAQNIASMAIADNSAKATETGTAETTGSVREADDGAVPEGNLP